MRRLLPFLACLMLVLTGMSGMAHAADLVGGSVAGVEFTVHSHGDGDEVPADGDKGVPHHHTICHGHDVGETVQPHLPAATPHVAIRPASPAVASLVGTTGFVALRPPLA